MQRSVAIAGLLMLGSRAAGAASNANAQDSGVAISVLSPAEAVNLIQDARNDRSVKKLATWLAQTKKWTEKTFVPFTVKGKDIEVTAVALIDAATTGIIVYAKIRDESGTSTSAFAMIPVPNERAKLFLVTTNGVEEAQTSKLPDTRPEYKVLHSLRPTSADGAIQLAASDCCTLCRNCSLSDIACAAVFACCLIGGVPCCAAGLAICFAAILNCSNSAGCNCIGACA
jgi:hypothetical protein